MECLQELQNTHTHTHTQFTRDFKSSFAVGQLQGKQPSEQLSYRYDGHQSPAHRLRHLIRHIRVYKENKIATVQTRCSDPSYLTDGGVRSPFSHHNVGMKINVVKWDRSRAHGHSATELPVNPLWLTWRGITGLNNQTR